MTTFAYPLLFNYFMAFSHAICNHDANKPLNKIYVQYMNIKKVYVSIQCHVLLYYQYTRARIFKLLRIPRIDSKKLIPPGYGGPVRQPYSYSVPSPYRLFKNSSTLNPLPVQQDTTCSSSYNSIDALKI
jgi:hypothetical protein